MRGRLSLVALLLLAVPGLAQSTRIGSTNDPCVDPALGFNLVSFANFGRDGESVWRDAITDLHEHGVCNVSLCPVRFVDPSTGSIAARSDRAPDLSHIAAAVAEAKTLGMVVTLNPFVEIEGFTFWRGDFNPTAGTDEAARFWSDYRAYILEVAALARAADVDFMTIGSELAGITRNERHNASLARIVGAVDAVFQEQLGYAANWDEFDGENLTAAIWDNPAIDFLGIDAYFSLADEPEADASRAHPDEAFISSMKARWNRLLDERIIPFARARKAGKGLPVVFTEFGFSPYGRTTVKPHQGGISVGRTSDVDEQMNGYQAFLEGVRGRKRDLVAIYAWHWGMPGSEDSPWYLRPNGVENRPNSTHDEALGNRAAEFLLRIARARAAQEACGCSSTRR
jgi:hypothetical protein